MQMKSLNKKQRQKEKFKNSFRNFRRIYPLHIVTTGLILGILLSVLTVASVAIAELKGRVLSPEEFEQINAAGRHEFVLDAEDPADDSSSGSIPKRSFSSDELSRILGDEFDPDSTALADGDSIKLAEDYYDRAVSSTPLQSISGVENILVIGVDTKTNYGRSDVMIIASLNHNTRTLSLVSLFRGSNVSIPGFGWNLLNASYSFGGANLLIRTIENNFRIPIHGYVIFNFNSFIKAIDVMGGVSINLTGAEAAALGMPAGNNWATSSQALKYVRLRKIDSDFNRMGRQRKVMNAVLNQLANSGPTTIYNVATVMLPSVATNLNVMSYVSKAPEYLSYSRKQMQIPRISDMWKFYNGYGQETWGFNSGSTVSALHNFLAN